MLAQWGLIPILKLGPRASALSGITVAALGVALISVAFDEHAIAVGMGLSSLGFGLFRPGFTAGSSLAVTRAEQRAKQVYGENGLLGVTPVEQDSTPRSKA